MHPDSSSHLVAVAARRYSRRCWWVDPDDLRQVGALAVVEAKRTFDPAVGVAPEQYYWRAIVLSMRRYLWLESSPVSGGKHRPEESLAGHRRAEVSDEAYASIGEASPAPEEEIADREWHACVQERLTALASELPGGLNDLALLLDQTNAQEIAAVRGTRLTSIYQATARLRAKVRDDDALYALMIARRKT